MLLLKSINDVNLPKFLKNDMQLFNGIAQDLFPETKLSPINYPGLLQAIEEESIKSNILKTKFIETKIL